jgi:hypothetical protein
LRQSVLDLPKHVFQVQRVDAEGATVLRKQLRRGQVLALHRAQVSRSETLVSGESFGSGAVESGRGLERLPFLKSGDVVELELEGIGVQRNRVSSHHN